MSSILIVEDDQILLEMYRDKFVHEKFTVQTAVDGRDGLEKMRASKPDVVLLDLIMPKVSGFDVLKIAKDDPTLNKTPIVVLTNIFVDTEDLVKNWGTEYVLIKANTKPKEVVRVVNTLLSRASHKASS